MLPTRRATLAGALGVLAGCNDKDVGQAGFADPLEAAVAGPGRPAEDRERDAWRHPLETLRFFGLQPGQTVVEFWPGAGWQTAILAPFLAATRGRFTAAQLDPEGSPVHQQLVARYQRRFADARRFGRITVATFSARSSPPAPPETADLAIFALALHAWMAAGLAEKAFADARAILRPGGVLGIEQHRAAPSGVQDPLATSGYVQQSYVRRLAEEAGFSFDGASEVNADPLDGRDRPAGAGGWGTDRMTLRFRRS